MVTQLGSTAGDAEAGAGEVDGCAAPDPDWAAIRSHYESGKGTVDAICREHGVSKGAVRYRAEKEGWTGRYNRRRIDRRAIVTRMFRLLESQLVSLENNFAAAGDKEAAMLGRLTGTLEKLIEIDNAEPRKGKGEAATSQDMKELRDKLVQRIVRLTQD